MSGGSQWEIGIGTITGTNTFTRAPSSSSNGGSLVNFSAGTKTVIVTLTASLLSRMPIDRDVAFSQTVPLDQVGITWMAPTTATSALAFTPAAGAVKGAFAQCRVTGDGTNDVTAPGFKLVSGSGSYDKTAGTVNIFEFEYDGYDYMFAVGQRGNAAAADSTPPTLTSPTASSTGTTTGSGSVTTNEGNGTLYYLASTNATETATTVKTGATLAITSTGSKPVTVSGLTAATTYYLHFLHRDAAGNDSSVANSASFTTSASGDTTPPTLSSPVGTQTGPNTATATVGTDEANGTLYYMVSTNTTETATTVKAGSSQAVTATGTQNVSFSGLTASTTYYSHFLHRDAAGNDSTVANGPGFTTASATAPSAPPIGTATAGDSSASVAFSVPSSTGGAPILDYTATASPGGATATGSSSPITVTGLTNGTAYTFTVHARNTAGNSAESAASNSVTPAASSTYWPKLLQTTNVTESGTGPYTYTGNGTALSTATNGGVVSKSLAANADGYIEFKATASGDVIVGFRALSAQSGYNGDVYALFITSGGAYYSLKAGVNASLGVSYTSGDVCRITRVGNVFKLQKAAAATPTSFTDLATYDYGSAPQMYIQVGAYENSAVQLTGSSNLS
jgi:hypothetical protein